MACHRFLLAFYLFNIIPCLCLELPLKGVNLGNWLVVEGWMQPSLFYGIPHNDLLDGTKVQFKSTKLQKYLSAESGGGNILVANRTIPQDWETFRLWRINETFFNFRVNYKQFVGLESDGVKVVAVSDIAGYPETFQIIRNKDDRNRVRLQASNGRFLQVKSQTVVTANYGGSSWEDHDPSVFIMQTLNGEDNMAQMRGEYQITNGYGPEKAPQVMQNHWNDWITEEDFSFMSSHGINAVRIPVGWWMAYDPPPKPFVGGSSQALDRALNWAEKYGIKVIVDLHAAFGSQNGNDHSGARDGYLEWGEQNIQETVYVIDFLAQRFAKYPSLAAIELMNEPWAPGTNLQTPGIHLDTLVKYYQAGYDAVRRHTQNAHVILSNRLGHHESTELLSFASKLSGVVIDVHYYNQFNDDLFGGKNAEWNMNYIRTERASELQALSTTNGVLSFVGEWTGEWDMRDAPKEDYQKFINVQQEVYGKASFGWAYWAYKLDNPKMNHWNFRWMIENDFMKVN